MDLQTFILFCSKHVEQNCHVLVTTLNLACHHISWKQILKTNYKFEDFTHVYPTFCSFGDFYLGFVERKCPCLIGVY